MFLVLTTSAKLKISHYIYFTGSKCSQFPLPSSVIVWGQHRNAAKTVQNFGLKFEPQRFPCPSEGWRAIHYPGFIPNTGLMLRCRRSFTVDPYMGCMPQAISSCGWHQNKIFIGLLWVFTRTLSPSICGTEEWMTRIDSLFVGNSLGGRLNFQESAVSMTL